MPQVDGAGGEGRHDGFLFGPVGDGDLALDSNEKNGAVFFLPLEASGELRKEVIDGDDLTFGEFVDGVFGDRFFGVSAFFDLPDFLAFGKEEDVEAEALHGLADIVFQLLHFGGGLRFEFCELGLGGAIEFGKAVLGGEPDGDGGSDGEGGEDEVELPMLDFGEEHFEMSGG